MLLNFSREMFPFLNGREIKEKKIQHWGLGLLSKYLAIHSVTTGRLSQK